MENEALKVNEEKKSEENQQQQQQSEEGITLCIVCADMLSNCFECCTGFWECFLAICSCIACGDDD